MIVSVIVRVEREGPGGGGVASVSQREGTMAWEEIKMCGHELARESLVRGGFRVEGDVMLRCLPVLIASRFGWLIADRGKTGDGLVGTCGGCLGA